MNLVNKTLIFVVGALLCTSCSSYYSKHATKDKRAAMLARSQAQQQRDAQKTQAAKTHGVNLAKNVDESDNQITDDENHDGDTMSRVRLSKWEGDNKCLATKPLGGSEQHYYFDFNKSSMASSNNDSLKNQAQYLLQHPNAKIRVEGNADDRGSREYNIALAARRAKAIIAALKQEGVSEVQCTMVSYGAEKPAAKGENEESYHCNRRVDIVYEAR